MRRGAITDEDTTFTETWQNIAHYQNAIIRLDTRGDEKFEVISGNRTFYLTTEERLITQDRIADKANDPFLNGSFRPVVVPDTVTVETNPNALSDEEILAVFASSDFAWSEWLANIDSAATLRRMLELADDADVSLKRYRQVEEQLVRLHPRARIEIRDEHLKRFLNDRPSSSPSSEPGAARARGGRSTDYR
jgi:hypothetical protein